MIKRWLACFGLLIALIGCKVELYTDLSERDANEMVAVLVRNDIPAQRQVKGKLISIIVDEDRFGEAVDVLQANGLPRQDFDTIGEVFKREGMISSPTEERARYVYALSQELSQTITEIDGVLSARIHVVLPENDPLRRNVTPSSASVVIRHDSQAVLDSLVPRIKLLVANSIEGLAYEKISVALFPVDVVRSEFASGSADNQMLETVAGFWVHESSASGVRFLLIFLILVVLISVVCNILFFLMWRRDQMRPVKRITAS